MKKIIILAIMLAIISIGAMARESILLKDNAAKLELVRVDPSPLKPGSVADIVFEITNVASTSLGDVRLQIVDTFPYTLPEGEAATTSIANINPGEKKTVTFRVKVNSDASEGMYPLSVQYYSDRNRIYTNYDFSLNIVKASSAVSIDSITVTPNKIPPGGTAEISVHIMNSFQYEMKDVSLKLDLNSASIPFAPLDSTAERKIAEIKPGATAIATFNVVTLPSVEANIYKIPLNVQYYDDAGKLYNKSDLIGVIIWDKPEISVNVKETSIILPERKGTILLNVINKGLTNVKLMSVTLKPSEDYEILSPNSVYVGSLDSDDDETAEFKISLKSKKSPVILPVLVEYRDANNEKYQQEENVELKLYTQSELGGSNGTLKWIIVILAIAGIIGYVVYRRRKKR